MPAEPPPESSKDSPAAPTPAAPPADLLPRADARALDEAEKRLNSPTPLTLRLLGVVFVATLLPWVAAKTACNLRDSPVRQPHDPPTEQLAKNAKSAALELAQRAASGRYREAAELARGDVASELLAADARCQAEPAPCERLRAQAEHVFTRAVVASRGPFEASLRTESVVGNGPPERFALHLTQDGGRWYVTRRAPLEGPIDAPVSAEEMVAPIAIRESPGPGNMSIDPHDPRGASAPGISPHGPSPQGPGAPSGTPAPPH